MSNTKMLVLVSVAIASCLAIASSLSSPNTVVANSEEYPQVDIAETLSSGDPLPECGEYITKTLYGPIDVADLWWPSCPSSQKYRKNDFFKEKLIYQNGSIWNCWQKLTSNVVCQALLSRECEDSTCFTAGL